MTTKRKSKASKKSRSKDDRTPPGVLSSKDLCARLGISAVRLSQFRSAGLKPASEVKGRSGRPAAFWDLQTVRDWMATNIGLRVVAEAIPTPQDAAARLDDAAAAVGFDGSLGRAAAIEQAEFARYISAIRDGDQLQVGHARRGWLSAAEQLRRLEKDSPEIKRQKSELVSKSEVESEMARMCLTVKQQMLSLKGSLPVLLAGRDEATISVELDKAIRAACLALTSGDPAMDQRIDTLVDQLLSGKL